ncbi:haloacid dehalogenase, type II [Anaeromyxobacter dehalogenans 2CP-1]|uniref:Haloacid dehalogenase, type II n=1 Tax=Anaeromyxobacter dehalogenans (strain ATCC BAA-258 / DSM 21875 / 2CP-1) TaxID=455488 RepID=B8J8J2_ANAD2|nr:haloacid dehalogenase type II [Anaeromyxobacter dehalogenans]ACL67278.1 haloacid dehalogenase, type II [Anaeromyxobacter dehalogenans 2CP-1]
MALAPVRAAVFDAYGTLFDVASAAAEARGALGDRWQPLAELWRSKQLQYTWLRSLAGRHADFWQVTGDAVDFALEALGLADAALRARLMESYRHLAAYPEAKDVLTRLRGAGVRLAVLSNGAPAMLASAAESAGLAGLLEQVLSVEDVGVYKPHPAVYRLAVDRLGVPAAEIVFVSSNGWDAFGAKAFGYQVAWCNRAGQPAERLPAAPDAEIRSLAELPPLLGLP